MRNVALVALVALAALVGAAGLCLAPLSRSRAFAARGQAASPTDVVETTVREQCLLDGHVALVDMKWCHDRCEIIIDVVDAGKEEGEDGPRGLSSDDLARFHGALNAALQANERLTDTIARTEIVVATRGVGDVLTRDIDFRSFRGFPVRVSWLEKTQAKSMEGTLVGRDADWVRVSVRGRAVKVPRSSVTEVRLPPARREPGDPEAHKLR